ncbi:hypothetical protein RvY_10402-2 [Ramazzottius varieornatus]|uniref:Small ribosomal subunit protein bS6m n=1 Tax=Ramazzottius varieornatus TaxID=947166 RepID=A0A1D1VHZ0_RAMVA|nr:hypothetical protein RvY_10402-2 [Ramazzottius varieornatus]
MPTYEVVLLTKQCRRPEARVIIRRISDLLWSKKGLIRDIEFMGDLKTPVRIHAHGSYHWNALYWLLSFDMPVNLMRELPEEFKRDVDVLKFTLTRKKNEETIVQKVECLLEEESLPPAHRQDVADLIKYGKRPVPSRQL